MIWLDKHSFDYENSYKNGLNSKEDGSQGRINVCSQFLPQNMMIMRKFVL